MKNKKYLSRGSDFYPQKIKKEFQGPGRKKMIFHYKHLKYSLCFISFTLLFLLSLNLYGQSAPSEEYDPKLNPRYFQPSFLNEEIVPKSVQNTGAASFSVPIQVPPGRGGIAVPRLALTYNSRAGNGWLGVGWNIGMDTIQRETKKGLDYSGNEFVINGSEELVLRPDWGPDFFGAKIEESFTKYWHDPSSGGWVAFQKDGTLKYYGIGPASRQENSRGVFKWCLERIIDSNGNSMSVEYSKDRGEIYLSKISYNDGKNYILFEQEDLDRWDIITSYRTFSKVEIAKRLKSIKVYGNGIQSRTYELEYEMWYPDGTIFTMDMAKSRLKTIRMDPLKPIQLSYGNGGGMGEFKTHKFTHSLIQEGLSYPNYFIFEDVNGDGRTDLIKRDFTDLFVYLGTKEGVFASIPVITHAPYGHIIPGKVHIGDSNGDGLPDLFKRGERINSSGFKVSCFYTYLSRGDGSFIYTGASTWINNRGGARLADLNRDGKADLIQMEKNGKIAVYLAKSDGSGTFETEPIQEVISTFNLGLEELQDVNGDGLADLIYLILGTTQGIRVHFCQGDGTFAKEGIWTPHEIGYIPRQTLHYTDANSDGIIDLITYDFEEEFTGELKRLIYIALGKGDGTFAPPKMSYFYQRHKFSPGKIQFDDINCDGFPDMINVDFDDSPIISGHGGFIDVYLGKGDGTFYHMGTTSHWQYGRNWNGYFRILDINGDGKKEFISLTYFDEFDPMIPENAVYVYYQEDLDIPNLLTQKTDSYGSVANLEYTPSSEYENFSSPFVNSLVSSIRVNDGLGNRSEVKYDYFGGYYDPAEREFQGFRRVTQINPNHTKILSEYYNKDPIRRGKIFKVDFNDPEGKNLIQSTSYWDAVPQGTTQAHFLKMIKDTVVYFDTKGDPVGYQINLVYDDSNGNLLSKSFQGSYAEGLTLDYDHSNYSDWLWRKTRVALTGEKIGKLREVYYTYQPVTGNLLSKEFWLQTGPNPKYSMTYDSYGNPITLTDARGNTTRTEYDPVMNTFPSRIIKPQTDGTDHIEEIPSYDYRWGQPTVKIDENRNVTTMIYDNLGRIVQTDFPDGGQETKYYNDSSVPHWTLTRIKEDDVHDIETYEYFDGLNRLVQTLVYGEAGKLIVSRKYYDYMGRNYLNHGPFFASGAPDFPKNPSGDFPYEKTFYDFQDRPIKVESPDSAHGIITTLFEYDGFDSSMTDPDGARKTEKSDYLGRIYQVVEHNGSENYLTEYIYNAAGDLLGVKNALGIWKTFVYDTLGRQTLFSDPDLGKRATQYDENGNIRSTVDAMDQTILFEYDELDRVVSKTYNPVTEKNPPVTFTYDNPAFGANGIGKPWTISNVHSTRLFSSYDAMGRQLNVVEKGSHAPKSEYVTQYSYDYSGKMTRMTYPDGFSISQTYHPGTNLIHRIIGSDSVEYVRLENFEPSGKTGSLFYGNNTHTIYLYDPKSQRLSSITASNSLGEMLKKAYTYTPAGDIASVTNTTPSKGIITYYYEYDKLHRLIRESNNGPADPYYPMALEMIHDDTRRPYHSPAKVIHQGKEHIYEYDLNGNLIMGTVSSDVFGKDPSIPYYAYQTYTYNGENKPALVSRYFDYGGPKIYTITTEFTYNGEGNRIRKRVKNPQSGFESNTFYIDNHFEIQNSIETKYVFAGNQRIAQITPEGIHFFHKDHLGSSSLMTSHPHGEVTETTEYLPFGGERSHSGTNISQYKFTDQEKDPSTGLYNYDARQYDTALGLFTSPDPVVLDWYDPQSLNRFAYTRNNPLKYVDPSGNAMWEFPKFYVTFEINQVKNIDIRSAHLTGEIIPKSVSETVTLKRVIASGTAKEYGIMNMPTAKQFKNIKRIIENIYEPTRKALGLKSIGINSGFRTAELNKKIEGSADYSQHMADKGAALDLQIYSYKKILNKHMFDYIRENLVFDQLIWYSGDDPHYPKFIHVSFTESENRFDIKRASKLKNKKYKYKKYREPQLEKKGDM